MTYPRPSTSWGVVGMCVGVCSELVSVKYHHLHTLLHTTHVAEIDSTSLYSHHALPPPHCRALQLYSSCRGSTAIQLYSLYSIHPSTSLLRSCGVLLGSWSRCPWRWGVWARRALGGATRVWDPLVPHRSMRPRPGTWPGCTCYRCPERCRCGRCPTWRRSARPSHSRPWCASW